jgi:hypothetical protein
MVLQGPAALELDLVGANESHRVVVVISHDCDIANLQKEPQLEVIVGRRIAALGADANAKTPRRLHIAFQTGSGLVPVELEATGKRSISNQDLRKHSPCPDWTLQPEDLVILQAWLAARYRRSAFPEQFEERLRAVSKKIVKALVPAAQHIIAVFFDVDGGREVARSGPDDLYGLRILLLYDSRNDESSAHTAADLAADMIADVFEAAFLTDAGWKNIQLFDCFAVSDSVMTIAQSRLLKEWRLEYVSLEDDPQQPMLHTT